MFKTREESINCMLWRHNLPKVFTVLHTKSDAIIMCLIKKEREKKQDHNLLVHSYLSCPFT